MIIPNLVYNWNAASNSVNNENGNWIFSFCNNYGTCK